MFFEIFTKGIDRFIKCKKYMHDDEMQCKKIPKWIQDSFNNDNDKSFYKRSTADLFWKCIKCNFKALNSFDLFSNKICQEKIGNHHHFIKINKFINKIK